MYVFVFFLFLFWFKINGGDIGSDVDDSNDRDVNEYDDDKS